MSKDSWEYFDNAANISVLVDSKKYCRYIFMNPSIYSLAFRSESDHPLDKEGTSWEECPLAQ